MRGIFFHICLLSVGQAPNFHIHMSIKSNQKNIPAETIKVSFLVIRLHKSWWCPQFQDLRVLGTAPPAIKSRGFVHTGSTCVRYKDTHPVLSHFIVEKLWNGDLISSKILSEAPYLNDIFGKEVTSLNFHYCYKLLLPKPGKKNGRKKEHCITSDTTNLYNLCTENPPLKDIMGKLWRMPTSARLY